MSKKIYITLSIILLLSLPFLSLGLDWSNGYFLPLAILAVAAFLALAAVNFQNAILLIILIMPAVYHFNYLKINIFNYLPFLNDYAFYLNPASIIYLLLILFGLLTLAEKKRELKTLPLKYILALASVLAAASISWSVDPRTSLIELVYLLAPFSMYLIAYAHFSDYGSFLKLLFAAILSSIIPLGLAAGQLFTGSYFYEPDSSLGRLTGGLDHPNTLGLFLFLIISLLASWYLAKADRRLKNSKLIFFCLAGLLFFLVMTYSRTSWVSLAVFTLLLVFLEKKIILFLLAALPAGAITLLASDNIKFRLLEIFDNALFSSVAARLNIWRVSFEQILIRPFLGYGAGAAETVIDNAKPWRGGISLPHNDYLLQTLELGLIGLIIFIIYTFGAIYHTFQAFKSMADKNTAINFGGRVFTLNFKVLAFGLLALLIALLPAAAAESVSQKIIIQIIIWPLLGGLLGLKKTPAA
ncbi:MAG: O-antigen ligase family protein [bacterium]|nr:O-antigen ligase family protein [bacterium]